MQCSKLLSLKRVVELLGDEVSVASLRREVKAGRIKAVRVRPGHNSKILISEHELQRWLAEDAGERRVVRRPSRSAGGEK